jgi:hypothetical protein
MPDDAASAGETGSASTDGTRQMPIVRHFRQIVVWPLQLVSKDQPAEFAGHHAVLEEMAPNHPWRPLEDEFGCRAEDFQERHYREFVSFLPHVRRFLYGDAPENGTAPTPRDAPMRVYRREDIKRVRITLDEDTAPVICDMAHADLYFFYDVDAVILVCEITANNLPLDVAQSLIQRFGRAYPAGWRDGGEPLRCPALVEWIGADGRVLSASNYRDSTRYLQFVGQRRGACVAAHWEFLLNPLVNDAGTGAGRLRFLEIEYYRMPVMAYLVLDNLKELRRTDFISFALGTTLAPDGRLPFSERFLADFEARHAYERLYSSGLDALTLDPRFLTSGDVFSIVSGGTAPSLKDNERGLLGQFRHQYFLLFLIAHFHKAALMMISDRMVAAIKRLDPLNPESVRLFRDETFDLQETFLRFSQRYLFKEVSGRAHMRDLFRMIRNHLNIDALHEEVRDEIFDMVQYLDSQALRRQSGSMHRLTVVTIMGMVGTIVTGFLGMNLIAEAEAPLTAKMIYFACVTAATAGLTAAALVYSRRLTRLFEKISGEDRQQ